MRPALAAVAPREVAKNVRSSKMSTAAEAASLCAILFARLEAVRFRDARRLIAPWKGTASAVPINESSDRL